MVTGYKSSFQTYSIDNNMLNYNNYVDVTISPILAESLQIQSKYESMLAITLNIKHP